MSVVETFWRISSTLAPKVNDPKTATVTQITRSLALTREQHVYVAAILTVAEVLQQQTDKAR